MSSCWVAFRCEVHVALFVVLSRGWCGILLLQHPAEFPGGSGSAGQASKSGMRVGGAEVSLCATASFTVPRHSFFSLMGAISATDWVVALSERQWCCAFLSSTRPSVRTGRDRETARLRVSTCVEVMFSPAFCKWHWLPQKTVSTTQILPC